MTSTFEGLSARLGQHGVARALRGGALVALLALPTAGCSNFDNPFSGLFGGEKYVTKIVPDVPPDRLYDQGLAQLNKRDYAAAAKRFSDLDKQYPYSQWQRKAVLMDVFAHYQAGEYSDSISGAQRYLGLYPTSPDAPYATYLEAMSYYNQIPDISHDQDTASKASVLFQQIAEKYPTSDYADDARYKLQVTRDQLAAKEMSVGRFYLKRHNYTAAINRFREVLAKYQTTRHAEEALERLTEAYLGLGIPSEAQTAAAVLGHNFPASPWYKDAFALLEGSGLQPNEDSSSWISKAFKKVGLG